PRLPGDLPDAVREAIVRADLQEAEAHLAWELARLVPGLDEDEHLALLAVALLTQEALGRGSTRIPRDVAWLSAEARAVGFDEPVCDAIPRVFERAPALFGAPGERRPLIVDNEHLYQERLLALEERLSALLAERVSRAPSIPSADAVDAIVAR